MDDPPPPNPYKTLNVPKDATLATIRSAHRKLVLSCHPDKVQDESAKKVKAEQFHQVQQAYEILSDDKRRQRYDEKVKLDELRAEMANDRPPPLSRRATDFEYVPSRAGPPPRRETRDNVIYEHIQPRARYSDEDYPSPRYDPRSSSKTYDDDYYHTSSARRTSGRASEEKRKARDIEDERDRRRREREEEAYAREQRRKRSDKDKKRNTETKSKSKHSPYVDSASDSEVEDRYYSTKREPPPRPRYEEIPLRSRDDPRKNDRFDRSYDDELEYKISGIHEHMNRTREAVVESEPRRPTRNRAASNMDSRPPPTANVDSTKRPSLRRGLGSRQVSPVRSSKKERRSPEIVDPPSSRKLPTPTSDPKGLKQGSWGMRKEPPQRSATYQPTPEVKQPQFRRSETMPIDRMQRNEPLKSSNLKNMKAPSDTESSDSDSEMTESTETPIRPAPRPSLRQKTTSYVVSENQDSYKLEPQEAFPQRVRESSPKIPHAADRPMASRASTTTRTPPLARSSTFQDSDRTSRPSYSRTDSARPTPTKSRPLFHEIVEEDDYKPRRSAEIYAQENSRSSKQYSRRRSEDVGRDDYPGSKFHRSRPVERGGIIA